MTPTELKTISSFLKQVSFFSEVSSKSLEHFSKNLQFETYKKNENIFKKNDTGDSMYTILSGKVKVHENDHVYGYLSKGECFGEYALIDNQSRSASITANEDTKVLKIYLLFLSLHSF